ncbi:hypothetical protein Tco_0729838 [Tanacetum coccineum]|uniref:Uncharacterized protein n=1 Tax=Tanacetum coccineum TaxID=301880 RepID=A0ABQ4YSS5_9ASTR
MNPQETQQVAARNEKWVPSAKRAFTISADVLEIFMQQFWTILNICPRVEGEDFTDIQDNETTLTFLLDLGYKGPLNRHTNMFVDHMHQPWRTLAAIINNCLSRKTTSNDKLRKSRIDILWGMINRESVDYPELIWEDIAYQIDHMKENRSRRENMPYPRFTKIIINHFLKQHKSLTNLNHKHYHTIKDHSIHLESYQMFIKYLTNQILPKKSRGKGLKGRKAVDDSQETVDVSEESEPELEPEHAKKKIASRRVVKKKVTLSVDDNIIFDDPDAALELAKSISQTEAKEAKAARKVHTTHARIVTESISESAKKKSSGRSSKSVVIQDTPSSPKSKPATSKTKLEGAPSLTPQEQEAADIMQALKESKKTSRRQPGTRGSHEGTGSKLGVLNESTVVSATSSEGTGTKLGVLDEDKDITKEKVILKWGDEQDSEHSDDDNDDAEKDDKYGDADDEGDDHVSDTQDADDEDVETESDDDDIYKYKIHVHKDEDVEMKDTEVEESDKGEGFGDQFLKLSSDSSLVSTIKDSADADVSSLLDIPIQHETPQIQSPSVQKIPHLPELTKKPTSISKQESKNSPSEILKIKKEQAESQKKP